MRKKILSAALAFAMVLSLFPAISLSASAAGAVSYRYPVYNKTDGSFYENASSGIQEWKDGSCTNFTEITNSTTSLSMNTTNGGWYVVTGNDVKINSTVTVTGHVHLILADGCKLSVTDPGDAAGICVSGDGNSLTIYAQSFGEDMGKLTATSIWYGAGIGGGYGCAGSNITINGGNVTATGKGAGIGGGERGCGKDITINGGTVTASTPKSGGSGAGIGGGGTGGSGTNITINGGEVTATSGWSGAGIGGGSGFMGDAVGNGKNITINGGEVTATSGWRGAGIGGGWLGFGEDIKITGGTVTATGGKDGGAGIGGGCGDTEDIIHAVYGKNITITGGTVTATGGEEGGAGIGNGRYCTTPAAVNIKIAATLEVKADGNNPPTTVVDCKADEDLAAKESFKGKRYVVIQHKHKWEYSGETGKLVATCSCDKNNKDCIYMGKEGAERQLTLTVTAPSGLVYNGSGKTVTVGTEEEKKVWADAGLADQTVAYYKDTSKLDSAPQNAGTYTAKISPVGVTATDGNTASAIFTISKAPLTISAATVADKTYDGTTTGTVESVTFGGLLNGDTLTLNTDFTATAQFDKANANGEEPATKATVTVTLLNTAKAQNYSLSVSTTKVDKGIGRASLSPTVTLNGWTVGGEANSPAVRLPSDFPQGAQIAYSYKAKDAEGEYSTSVPTEVGSYTVKAVIPETDNYNAAEATADFTISNPSSGGGSSKATVTIPVEGDKDAVKVQVTVSGTNATIKNVTATEIEKVGTESTVAVNLTSLDPKVTGMTIPKTTIENIAASEAQGLEVKFPNHVTAVFDKTTLSAVAEQAEGKNIQLVVNTGSKAESTLTAAQKETVKTMNNPLVLDAYLVSNGTRISDFGGGSAKLTAPYTSDKPVQAWYVDADGSKEAVLCTSDGETGSVTVSHFSHYVIETVEGQTAVCPKDDTCVLARFTDTDPTLWYHDGIHFCVEQGYMNGVKTDRFAPSGTLSRGMLVTMLWRMEGSPVVNYAMTFTNVAADEWYTEAVRWAADSGLVNGYRDTSFAPNDNLTREQLAAILYRLAESKGEGFTGASAFHFDPVDRADISDWASEAMRWCYMKGILTGDNTGALKPTGNATRAEAATMLQRFCEAMPG